MLDLSNTRVYSKLHKIHLKDRIIHTKYTQLKVMFGLELELFRARKGTANLTGVYGTIRIWHTLQCYLYCGDNFK